VGAATASAAEDEVDRRVPGTGTADPTTWELQIDGLNEEQQEEEEEGVWVNRSPREARRRLAVVDFMLTQLTTLLSRSAFSR